MRSVLKKTPLLNLEILVGYLIKPMINLCRDIASPSPDFKQGLSTHEAIIMLSSSISGLWHEKFNFLGIYFLSFWIILLRIIFFPDCSLMQLHSSSASFLSCSTYSLTFLTCPVLYIELTNKPVMHNNPLVNPLWSFCRESVSNTGNSKTGSHLMW